MDQLHLNFLIDKYTPKKIEPLLTTKAWNSFYNTIWLQFKLCLLLKILTCHNLIHQELQHHRYLSTLREKCITGNTHFTRKTDEKIKVSCEPILCMEVMEINNQKDNFCTLISDYYSSPKLRWLFFLHLAKPTIYNLSLNPTVLSA